ncbi:MAG: sugar ABC transporter ATP-binding protein [Eubacteriales bacterium]|nr:sugar ABC transporter ATP-binding protein [Eubacteriales bacterium]
MEKTRENTGAARGPALELKNITKLYSGTVALREVSLSVERGQVHGLIGKNGAGKSTLVGVMSGLVEPSSGEILVDGEHFRALTPAVAKRHRISIITQEPQVIEESTVAENLFFPHYLDGKGIIDWRELSRRAGEILREAGLVMDPALQVRDLSVSERQLLLVIKACFVENGELIIMDEVSASLSRRDQGILYEIIRKLTREGKTVIFISHHTKELLQVCDVVTVIRDGSAVGSVRREDLDLKKLAALIVGNESYEARQGEDLSRYVTDEELFSLNGFTSYGKFRGVSLTLHKGEIVGLAGLRGSGRTELFRSIIGADPYDSGTMTLCGREVRYKSPAEAARDGVVYLTEEREAEGVIPIASVRHNLTMSVLPKLSRFGILHAAKERVTAGRSIKKLEIKVASQTQEVQQLSGGNKQKVLVGRVMEQKPRVCLLDEPTRGVDIEAKDSILHSVNHGFRDDACAIITSPGVDDLMKICDRILILYEGRITEEFSREEYSEEAIFRAMQGERIHEGEYTGERKAV